MEKLRENGCGSRSTQTDRERFRFNVASRTLAGLSKTWKVFFLKKFFPKIMSYPLIILILIITKPLELFPEIFDLLDNGVKL